MFKRSFFLCLLSILAWWVTRSGSQGAVTLSDATSVWRFDRPEGVANGSTVTGSQVKNDLNSAHQATSLSGTHQWTEISQVSQGVMGPSTSGIGFHPQVVTLNEGAANADSIRSSIFTLAGASVGGTSTLMMRIQWDGRVAGSDDNPVNSQYWLARNGYGAQGAGYLFGLKSLGSDPHVAALTYFTYQGSGGTASVNSSFNLYAGIWYDVAIVLDDAGDASQFASNRLTFYAYSQEYGLQSSTFTGVYLSSPATTLPGADVVVGGEAAGAGTGNTKKAFDGTMDYMVLFNGAMTQSDFVNFVTVPEPKMASLVLMALGGLIWRRNREV